MPQAVRAHPVISAPVPRGGMGVSGFYLTHALAAVFPLTAGLALYGWHAAAVVAGVVASAAVSQAVWKQVGPRGRTLHLPYTLWQALLLSLMLPAHLAGAGHGQDALWPIIPASGLLLVILMWLFGGLGGGHAHPALITYLLMVICFGELLVPHRVLSRDHLLTGELFHAGGAPRTVHNEPWIGRRGLPQEADYQEPAAERLTRYTSGREVPPRRGLTISGLLRDAMPPLEDFIIAGQPGAIGTSSVIAVVIGGLFLLYRGLIDYRIPLLACTSAYLALLLLPVPAVISNGPHWVWASLRLRDIGWSVGITFVNYEMMASPLIFMSFFIATATVVRPMTRRGRTIFALLVGVCSAVLQLYISVPYGPYVALVTVTLLTPLLDRAFTVRVSRRASIN